MITKNIVKCIMYIMYYFTTFFVLFINIYLINCFTNINANAKYISSKEGRQINKLSNKHCSKPP